MNLVGVGASSDLRKTENIFYPSALRLTTQPSSQVTTTSKVPGTAPPTNAGALEATSETSKELDRENTKGKEKEANKDKMPE